MRKFLLLLSVFTLFACKKDKGNDDVITIPASDYELSADGLTLVKWKNENTAVLNMQADAVLKNVKVIGKGAFYQHKNLGSITLPEGLTNIDNIAFFETKLKSIVIPKGVQVIGVAAFSASSLTSVQFSEGLITIDDNAFYECQIPILNFPESLQAIGNGAFHSNKVIVSFTVPKNIQRIGVFAFYACDKLTSAIFKGANPPATEFPVFNNVTNKIAHIYVPKGRLSAYKNDPKLNLNNHYDKEISEEE
ncbi:hypothetical protein RCZ04_23270 [Capnocytophaga sp. HP1101]